MCPLWTTLNIENHFVSEQNKNLPCKQRLVYRIVKPTKLHRKFVMTSPSKREHRCINVPICRQLFC